MTTMEDILDEEFARDEARINVEALVKEFKHYYGQLKISMSENRIDGSKNCYILFGISGAGKSTTVARLMSNESPRDFWRRIIDDKSANRTYTEMSGVTIGHTVNSCTVIPKAYQVSDELFICDMPGFAENDPQKKISIDLLSKIFLTNTKNLKIMVVAEVGMLFDEQRMTRLRQNYYDDLKELLGSSFPDAIDHFYFILTKNHLLKKTSEDIELRMARAIKQLNKARGVDDDYKRFLSRLDDAHVIVDLETDDNNDLLSAIKEKMAEDIKEHEVHRIEDWSIDHLEAGENLLNRLCLRHIAKQCQLVADLETSKESLIKESNMRFHLRDATAALLGKMEQALKVVSSTKKKVDDCRHSIEEHPRKKNELTLRKKDAEDLKQMCLKRQEIFSKASDGSNRYVIQARVDASLPKKNKGASLRSSAKEEHQLMMNPRLYGDGCINYRLVVAEYEADDKTIRDAFKTGNSLIPSDMEELKKLVQPSIIYNTANEVKRCVVERPGNSMAKEEVAFTIKHVRPFKVYIFTQIPFENVFFFQQIKADFQQETKEADAKIDAIAREIDNLDKKLKQNQSALKDFELDHQQACNAIVHLKEEVKQAQKEHEDVCDEIISKLGKGRETVVLARKDPRLADINDVIKILRTNNIQTSAGEPLQKLLASFLPLENSLDDAINTLNMFKKHDRDELTEIVSMSLPTN